jgi:hypothetical protein
MGIIFNELETIDLGVVLNRGDRIKVQLNSQRRWIEWFINGKLVCMHKMGG